VRHTNRNTIFASFGVATVLVELASVAIGAIGNRAFVTITSSPADVQSAFAKPVTTAAWVSAYMEMLSVGLFLAFAVWACARLGGGLVGSIATGAAVAYAAVGTVGLAVGDALAYRSGHGMDLQLATAMMTLNQALFVASWFLSVFFLLAVAPLALAAGRSVIGWSAVCIAVVILVTTAVSLDNLGQMSNLLWLIWIAGTAIGLARPGRVEATAAADAALA
jgi:hypothetical protein